MYYLNTKTPMKLFQKARNSKIYVDKSLLIEKVSGRIDTMDQYVCITRPRRFGKTVNANMLGAYYTRGVDSRWLFDGLHISKADSYAKHLNCHNVIYIDFSLTDDFSASFKEFLAEIIGQLQSDLYECYPKLKEREYHGISRMFRDTQDSFLFILDEWDSIFYKKFMTEDDKKEYLDFIRKLLKDQPYVDLAYMTGILPIAKYSSSSELNMFQEYNFMSDQVYETYFGLSEEEVRELCRTHKSVSFEDLKWWYDGYYLHDGRSLFNPRSVNQALSDGVCKSYWTETGPMNEVADCIEHNVDAVREDIVKMVAGIPVPAKLNGYSAVQPQLNTRDEILSAMVVYGFLSYYDGELRIPNRELMEKYEIVLSRESMGEVKQIVDRSKEMLKATLSGDEKRVAQMLAEVNDREIPFLQYNDENSLSCVITLCYLAARDEYLVEREAKSGKGFCDYLFLPKRSGRPAMILELKVDRSCEEAIDQIKEKGYMEKVPAGHEVLLVGINYSKKTKEHTCKIEACK